MNDDGWVQMHRRQRVDCLHFQEEEEEEEEGHHYQELGYLDYLTLGA